MHCGKNRQFKVGDQINTYVMINVNGCLLEHLFPHYRQYTREELKAIQKRIERLVYFDDYSKGFLIGSIDRWLCENDSEHIGVGYIGGLFD